MIIERKEKKKKPKNPRSSNYKNPKKKDHYHSEHRTFWEKNKNDSWSTWAILTAFKESKIPYPHSQAQHKNNLKKIQEFQNTKFVNQ